MDESKFKPGDAVRHKAGGPKMIFIADNDGEALCEWFDKGRKLEVFSYHALELD